MNPTSSKTYWRAEGNRIHFAAHPLTATLAGAAPHSGLGELAWNNERLGPLCLWRLDAPWFAPAHSIPLVETYVRGADFVATYGESPRFPLTMQWDCRSSDGLENDGGENQTAALNEVRQLELILSANTSVLDFSAALTVSILLPLDHPDEFAWDAQGHGGVVRPALGSHTLVFGVFPSDFASAQLIFENGSRHAASGVARTVCVKYPLFAQRLEKGVIRRARFVAAIGPRDRDHAWISELWARFHASPPPLTT